MRHLTIALLVLCSCEAREPARLHYEPATSPLTQRYGITPEESARRLNSEQYVGELNTRLHAGALPYFSDLWIQHEPTYAIKVAFTRPLDRAALERLAHPSIRRDLVIVVAERTQGEIDRDRQRVVAAFQGAPGSWGGGYNPKSGKFEFDVENQAVSNYARSRLPPDLRDDVVLRVTDNVLRTF